MKTCTRCRQEKPVGDFAPRVKAADGLTSWCKPCQAIASADYRARNLDKVKLSNAAYRAAHPPRTVSAAYRVRYAHRNRKWIWEHKLEHGCVDCAVRDPRVLQFDHIGDDKVDNISAMAARGVSLEKIQAEAAKCQVRCANCHAIVTGARANHYSHTWFTEGIPPEPEVQVP